jgi:hypothetical protein
MRQALTVSMFNVCRTSSLDAPTCSGDFVQVIFYLISLMQWCDNNVNVWPIGWTSSLHSFLPTRRKSLPGHFFQFRIHLHSLLPSTFFLLRPGESNIISFGYRDLFLSSFLIWALLPSLIIKQNLSRRTSSHVSYFSTGCNAYHSGLW